MIILNGQIGMTLEDHNEAAADIETGLRAHLNLGPEWTFYLSRGNMLQGGTPPQPLMSIHFFLLNPIVSQIPS